MEKHAIFGVRRKNPPIDYIRILRNFFKILLTPVPAKDCQSEDLRILKVSQVIVTVAWFGNMDNNFMIARLMDKRKENIPQNCLEQLPVSLTEILSHFGSPVTFLKCNFNFEYLIVFL